MRMAVMAVALLAALGLGPSARAACVVAVDAGHSRSQDGTTSARGVPEWQFNHALAKVVAERLRAGGITPFVVNPEGGPIRLAERSAQAARAGARLLISLHHDSVQKRYLSQWVWQGRTENYSDRFSGFSLFVSGRNPAFADSLKVAAAIGANLVAAGLRPSRHHAEHIPGEGRPMLDPQTGLYRFDNLLVLKGASMPAVLLEAGIIVNRADEERIASPAYRGVIADAITTAARAFCARLEKAGPIR